MKSLFFVIALVMFSTHANAFSSSDDTVIATCTAAAQGDWPAEAFTVHYDGQNRNDRSSYMVDMTGTAIPHTGDFQFPVNEVSWSDNGATLNIVFFGQILSAAIHDGNSSDSTMLALGQDPRSLNCVANFPK